MMSRTRFLIPALRELGAGALYRYASYQVGLRSGLLQRRTRPYPWSARPLESWLDHGATLEQALAHKGPFLFEAGDPLQQSLQAFSSDELMREADEIMARKHRLFGGPSVELGTPPDWSKAPLTSESISLDRHWTGYVADSGVDLRLLWEPSRFGWAFTLCRAYLRSGERRYATHVMELIGSWRGSNPPNMGPHWASGQECALRILALVFAWRALAGHLAEHRERAMDLLGTIAAHAERIPPTLSYARAQRNNHLLTEAVGLYTVGLQMPFFAKAAEWKQLGRREFIQALTDQVFDDGGYIQYSTNYQRLALSAGLWGSRLAEIHGDPLPASALGALAKMTEFLASVIDPASGVAPNWGHNDGSNILPLSEGQFRDYRPVVQAGARAFLGKPSFEPGAWDELGVWLGLGLNDEGSSRRRGRSEFPQSGLYVMRGENSSATLRCAQFTARPAHSDQLHFDLRWNEHNIAHDPGTYRYTTSGPWDFSGAEAHNAPVVDRQDPMDRAGRFLWLNWSDARFLGRWNADDGSVQAMAAEHPLREGITHRRSVVHAGGSMWVVMDELIGAAAKGKSHHARILWNLIDWPWELEGQRLKLQGYNGPVRLRLTPRVDTIALYRAGEPIGGEPALEEDAEVLGWWSPTYGYKEPALALVASLEGELPLRISSWWRLGDIEPQDLMLEWDSLTEDPLMAFLSTG